MRIETDVKLDYSNVLLRPKRSTLGSRKEVRLHRRYTFRHYQPNVLAGETDERHYEGIPIMAANMDGVATFKMADTLSSMGLFTCLVKTYEVNELVEFFDPEDYDKLTRRVENVAYSMGIMDKDMDKFLKVMELTNGTIKYVCVDVANGYSTRFADFIRKLRAQFSDIVIIAGNVVTGDQTQELILSGADIIKVGIGPGSVCTTRIQTGVGYPQLSAVMECADAAHGLGGHIIADGGCVCPGDVAKAFAGGADFVMLGGMLAGHDEGGGKVITKHYASGEYTRKTDAWNNDGTYVPHFEQKHFVQFYGMSSEAANEKHFGGLKEYRSSEGREVLVPYRGAVEATISDILGGIRSTCTYVGALKLKQLSKCATFIKCGDTHNRVYENN
ncbi:GMP reductase [bacterium]|nr:GMP reductase [bacterium]